MQVVPHPLTPLRLVLLPLITPPPLISLTPLPPYAVVPDAGATKKRPLFRLKKHRFFVCENAYLLLIGHASTNMWDTQKNKVMAYSGDPSALADHEDVTKIFAQTKHSTEQHSKPQFEHVQQFVEYYAKTFADFSVDASGISCDDDLKILPFEKISQLFEEYETFCTTNKDGQQASRTTFNRAYTTLKKEGKIRLTRSKGSFQCCDICNNANDLLLSKHWKKNQRDLIAKYKDIHLKQQAAERTSLDAKKLHAIQSKDSNGQPTHCLIFGDGMTKYAGRTPKYSFRSSKKDNAFFENRVFGVEVYCGPVSGEILIHTDDLVRGGANFTIEVQRRVIIELARILKVRPHELVSA